MLRSLVAWTCAASALAAAGCSSTKECTLIACESTAIVRMRANIPAADLGKATIEACRAEGTKLGCSTGRVAVVPSATGDRLQFSLSGAVDVSAFVSSPAPGKGYLLEFVYNLEGAATTDGDVYDVKVNVDNVAVATFNDQARYTEAQPNGPKCPPVCRSVSMDKS